MTSEDRLEIEVKIRITDPRPLLPRLAAAGFTEVRKRTFERNLVFDDRGGRLHGQGILLRLRQENRKVTLTVKQPAQISEIFKVRQEIEAKVDDFEAMKKILIALDFEVFFVYEKYRRIFQRRRLLVTVDETPIGNFLEIEGDMAEIDRAAGELGFTRQDYVTATYYQLFRETGRPGFMTFDT